MKGEVKRSFIWCARRCYTARIALSIFFIHKNFRGLFIRALKQNACIEGVNGDLILKSKSIFGPAKKSISIPKDKAIYDQFMKSGYWSFPTSYFISRLLKKMKKPLIVDFGAHVGLVSLQAIKMNSDNGKVIAVEALPDHFTSLQKNIDPEKIVALFGALVSDPDIRKVRMTVDTVNLGNSSALDEIVPKVLGRSYQINVPAILLNQVTQKINGSAFILKSDIQGHDAGVLARLGDEFWSSCLGGVIEVNAHKNIDRKDIEKLLERFTNYRHLSWQPFSLGRVSEKKLLTFWTSASGLERDIYFW
jgi:FkbM family methyltransferase